MQGASRGSLVEVREQLETVAAEADRPTLAAELRAVADLLVREPGLRRALSDGSREPQARVDLLETLVGQRVGAPTLTVLRTVAAARWSRPNDLVDAVETLAVDVELAQADATDSLAEVEDQLFRFGRIVGGDPQLARLLADAGVPASHRAELAASLLEGKADPVTVRLATTAVRGLGGRGFEGSLQRVVELAAARRDRAIAYVTTAAPLTPAQEERLAARLAEIYGRAVSLKVEVDPALLGGVTVRVGDDLYDGSVARRLELARGQLAG